MNKRVVTFGEIMLRLAPNGYYRFFQNDQLQATFGGGSRIWLFECWQQRLIGTKKK